MMIKPSELKQYWVQFLQFACTCIFLFATPAHAKESLPGIGLKVTPVMSPIIEERFQGLIIQDALKKLGYEIQPYKIKTYKDSLKAIAKGEATYSTSFWFPLHKNMLKEVSEGKQFIYKKPFISGAAQGYLIDKKTADQYNIRSLSDFKKPKIAKLFDINNDQKADFIGCQKDWGCNAVIEHQLNAYNLRNTVEHHQGTYSESVTALLERFNAGKSIFYYTWTPYWLSSNLKPAEDVIWLEVPFSAHPNGIDTTLANGKNYGFKVNNIHIISLKSFTLANPSVAKLFETASLSINEVSAQNKLIYEGENTEEDIKRHAKEWIKKNQKRFDRWIEKSMKANRIKQWP